MRGLSRLQSYFDVKKDDETLEIYIEELSRYSEEELKVLFSKIVRECEFFPRLKAMRELMGEAGGKQQAALTSRAYEAFEEALSMMRKVGSYRTPEFSDQLIPVVIKNRFGGWVRFGRIEVTDWTRKAFVEEYRALSEAGEVPQIELAGIHQRTQLGGGMKQIGDLYDSGEY